MAWTRLGHVYAPDGTKSWALSHAALPVPVALDARTVRFFFSTRAADNRSSATWVDVDLSGSPRVVREAREPTLVPGADGAFDDSGIGIGSVTASGDNIRLYYMGWNLGVRAPWRNAIGFAQADTPLSSFERFSPGPILDRSPEDPYTLSYPWVLRCGPEDWRMWYGSNLTWGTCSADLHHAIKAARSRDGVRWERDGRIAVGFATSDEYALARPSVVRLGARWLMCFACRGHHYRIGAAWSADGEGWTRADEEAGITPSLVGWDSEMVCYPALFRHRGQLWLAYNGNGYGRTGFGLAVWEGVVDLPSAP